MTKPNCCPTCQDWIESVPGARIPVCSNPVCECHTAKASSPASKLRRVEAAGVGDNNGFFEFTAKESSPESEWEEDFEEAKQKFIENMSWSSEATSWEKTLAIGNVNGFASYIKKHLADLPEKQFRKGEEHMKKAAVDVMTGNEIDLNEPGNMSAIIMQEDAFDGIKQWNEMIANAKTELQALLINEETK